MKITLHDSVPRARRSAVEAAVKNYAGECTISWMPSRFPRLVMLIEPESGYDPDPDGGSFFESPPSDRESVSAMTDALEARIKACLAR